jgi:AAA family ATP:ADP antiporter
MMTLLMFLLLSGYYLLKTAREVFILSEGGAEVKSYASAGQAVLLLVLVPAYGAFAARVGRAQLVSWVPLFFAFNIVLLRAGVGRGASRRRAVLPLARHLQRDGDRRSSGVSPTTSTRRNRASGCFPLIGLGSSLGAWLGSIRAGCGDAVRPGPGPPAHRRRVLLVACVGLARLVDRQVRRNAPPARAAKADERLGGGQSGFSMLLHQPLSPADCRAHAPPQRGQHHGRVPVRPLHRAERDRDVRAG